LSENRIFAPARTNGAELFYLHYLIKQQKEKQYRKYTKNNKVYFSKKYFPEKEYQGVKYPSGEYNSLVVTLGNGIGNNWWCVMFPPLCLLEAKEEETEDINYSFYVKDTLSKYFS